MAEQLTGPLLQSVSRSFYLSIRFLPRRLQEPVGLAYLLARATDTIADTTEISAQIRRPNLENLARVIHGDSDVNIETLPTSFAPLQTDDAERKLIELIPQCLSALERVAPDDRRDIRELLAKITRAQLLDLQRFGIPGNVRALDTGADLNEYTYLIAGCVGEFWTRTGVRHAEPFAQLPTDDMLELGRRYGAGLQLINILRDAGGDLRAGRCYLPNEDLQTTGLRPEQILEHPGKFMPIFGKWLDAAEQGIHSGMKYSLAVRDRRIRAATALPALIGARTIALLREAGHAVLEEKIKVPRSEVKAMVRSMAFSLVSPKRLERMFRSNLG